MGSTDNISVIVVFLNDFESDEHRVRYAEVMARSMATTARTSGRGSGESRSASMSSSAMRRHSRLDESGLSASGQQQQAGAGRGRRGGGGGRGGDVVVVAQGAAPRAALAHGPTAARCRCR
jgi:hypothetical protein